MINEKKIDDIININVENKTDRLNYRGVFAMYIITKDKQARSLVKTITKNWKKQNVLLKVLENFEVPEGYKEEEIPNYYT